MSFYTIHILQWVCCTFLQFRTLCYFTQFDPSMLNGLCIVLYSFIRVISLECVTIKLVKCNIDKICRLSRLTLWNHLVQIFSEVWSYLYIYVGVYDIVCSFLIIHLVSICCVKLFWTILIFILQSVLDVVVNLQFALIESLWQTFWRNQPDEEWVP